MPTLSRFFCNGSIPVSDDFVDVTIEFTTGERRWCVFMAPRYAARLGTLLITPSGWSFRLRQGEVHVHVIDELNETLIATALEHLDKHGALIAASLPLANPDR